MDFPAVASSGGGAANGDVVDVAIEQRLRRLRRRVGTAEIALAPFEISQWRTVQRPVPLVEEHSRIFILQVHLIMHLICIIS